MYVDRVTAPGYPPLDFYDTPPNPDHVDIVGGTDSQGNGPFAAGFWYRDADHVMFRIRVDDDPGKNPQTVWQVLLNTDSDTDADWSLQLDLSSKEDQVELVQVLSGGPENYWDIALVDPPHTGAGTPKDDFYRFVNASTPALNAPYTGSQFHKTKDDDFFVDLAYPLAAFLSTTGVLADFDFADSTSLSTSTTHTQTNKDLPDVSSWNDPTPVSDIPGAPGAPEPATLAMLGLGGLAVLTRRRKK